MAEATEISTTTYTGAANVLPRGGHGNIDANLVLLDETLTADDTADAINVEGGGMAQVVVKTGTVTGTTPTAAIKLECSIDGGSNYFTLIILPTLDGSDDNITLARAVWIPRPNTSNKYTKVRVVTDIEGTSPSFPLDIYLTNFVDGDDKGLSTLT